MIKVIWTILTLMVAGFAGTAAFVYSGFYNVAATEQHTPPVYWLLQTVMNRSVAVRARDLEVPDLSSDERFDAGLQLYQDHCVQCHGAPGVAPAPFSLSMTPVPPAIVQVGLELSAAEIFWTVKHGVKMTGMPGWSFKLTDEEIWDIAAFVVTAPLLSPSQYYELAEIEPDRPGLVENEGADKTSGDAEMGRVALRQYGCIACHTIEGITGPNAWVGPPLRRISERKYIAGVLPNSRENLVHWIRNPQGIDPLTAMPQLGVTEEHAQDIVAYLYSLGNGER
ncbi:c-type cytochrome [Chelativorans sp. YIM 93263]|uniref:c-type cytochrome n=1 Tax=Chelativorans sp. YIM 93263 TaxID=2906648 RepID=UPI00237912CD|nr:c-type cytochrome [Chelativorans sp. YIM 93263]